MPLANELILLILEKFERRDQKKALEWFGYHKQRIYWLTTVPETTSGWINIEQVFDLAKFDIELWKLKQHLSLVGRGDGPRTRRGKELRLLNVG